MTGLFFTVLRMSGYGLVAALVMLCAMLLLWRTRASKTALLALWLVVGFRLVCPWSPPSPLSLFNWGPAERGVSVSQLEDAYVGDYKTAVGGPDRREDYDRAVSAGVEPVRNAASDPPVVHYYENSAGNITPAKTVREVWGPVLSAVWLAGMAGMLGYGGVSYTLFKRRLRFAVKDEDLPGVWYSDAIPSPCVAGFVRPRIYLTFGMAEEEKTYVLAHERQHVRNGDHLWKVAGWLVLCVHWFNPLMWLCYRAFLWTVEEACDQRVLRELGEEHKADYGQALLSLSSGRRLRPGLSPLAFGEGDTKERVKTVLKYKKPLAWLTVIALTLCAGLAVCVLTSRADRQEGVEGAYGDWVVSNVIYLTPFSSSTPDYYLQTSGPSEVHVSQDLFSLEGNVNYIARSPVYEPLELGDSLPAVEGMDDRLFSVDLTPYDSVQGWKVLESVGPDEYHDTNWHVFLVDGRLWVGEWRYQSTASTPHHMYWSIFEAVREGSGLAAAQPVQSDGSADGEYVSPAPDGTEAGGPDDWPSIQLTATVVSTDPEAGTVTVEPEAPIAEGLSAFLFEWWDAGEVKPGDRVVVTATHPHQLETAGWTGLGTFDRVDEMVVLSGPLVEWSVDLTHDGVPERVYVTSSYDTVGYWNLIVEDAAGRVLWHDSASSIHAGQNGFYLCEEDGLAYILNWCSYMGSGYGNYWYKLFWLSPDGRQLVLRENSAVADINEPWGSDPAALRAFDAEINKMLLQSEVLLSTNWDTPEGVWYGDPAHPVKVTGPWDSGADWFERVQSRASGTYTFQADLVDVQEDRIIVQDRSLWADIADYSFVFVIPMEALRPEWRDLDHLDWDNVRLKITADGPLYRWELPGEGTHVEVVSFLVADPPANIDRDFPATP